MGYLVFVDGVIPFTVGCLAHQGQQLFLKLMLL
jgi:hypothetical protein